MTTIFTSAFHIPAFDPSNQTTYSQVLMTNPGVVTLYPSWSLAMESTITTDYSDYVSIKLAKYDGTGAFIGNNVTVAMNGQTMTKFAEYASGGQSGGLDSGETYVLAYAKVGTGGSVVIPPLCFTLKLTDG